MIRSILGQPLFPTPEGVADMSHQDQPFGPLAHRVMDMARRHLDMDVAFIARRDDAGTQTYLALDGIAESFGLQPGGCDASEETICNLMLQGRIANAIPDTSSNGLVRDLGVTGEAGIGSYIGVPLRHSDGTLYGTFCCIGHEAHPSLDDRDSRWMSMLSELLTEDLDQQRELDVQRTHISDIIAGARLETALQPVVDLASGRCVGVEALSRFDMGSPYEVFQQAEKVGLGLELEYLAARSALDLLPLLAPHQYLAVNASPEAGAEAAARAADVPGLRFDQVVWEMTEHAIVRDYKALRECVQPLKDMGLRVAIDDAGAGFASLHHIVELQPDIIKIDRSLIRGIASNTAQRSIVTGFVLLALDCEATLIAEGVETAEELDVVTSLGVEAAQGYLFARPSTDREDLARWQRGDLLRPKMPGQQRRLAVLTSDVG